VEGGGPGGDAIKKPEEEEWEKEESYLQGLVEKMQEKVDKEVARGVKVSSTQPFCPFFLRDGKMLSFLPFLPSPFFLL